MASYHDDFISAVEAFLKRTETSPTALGERAIGDKGFVFKLRNGRSPTGKTMDKILRWMAKEEKRRTAA